MSLHWTSVETRLGRFHVASHYGKLVTVKLPGADVAELWQELNTLFPGEHADGHIDDCLARAATQLQEYAEGVRSDFELPIELHGTDFQKQVWNALMDVPCGQTRSYADIAQTIGRPGAARAVGRANRTNRLPLVVPCHRVVAADGSLGGYMGDWGDGAGVKLKERLLALEKGQTIAPQ